MVPAGSKGVLTRLRGGHWHEELEFPHVTGESVLAIQEDDDQC